MKINSPAFIIDKKELTTNIRQLKNSLKNHWGNYIIGYSCKTNSLPWVLKFFKDQGCYAEVVSDFEYKLSKELGYTDENIVFNGPNKGRNTFIGALEKKCIVNIDSWREINWLKESEFKDEIKVGIRVNLNLEKDCPNETSVGIEGSRFGFSLENGDLKKAIDTLNSINNVKVVGIHLHHTAKTRSINIYRALSRAACQVKKLINYTLDYVDIGGGFFGGVPGKPTYDEYMNVISEELEKEFDKNKTTLIVEPGSALIASPIEFICDVVDVKDTFAKRIVTTNGSRNNIDPFFMKNSYIYEVIKLNNDSNINNIEEQVVCGYTCLDNDRIMMIKNENELSTGDRLVFKKVGAYTICLTPLFIEAFPKVYVRNENNSYECVRDSWDVNEYLQKSVF